jgi:hypothetical protein
MSETWEYADDPTPPPTPADTPFPWPPPEDGPILAALGATWKGAAFNPARFFGKTPRNGGTGAALVYYLALGILVAGATLFWNSMDIMGRRAGAEAVLPGLANINPLVQFLLAPALLLTALFVSAGVVHVLLLIFDGASHGFGTTVRVFCYAYSPALFGVIPVPGALIGSIWSVVLAIIGLREAHEAAAWKPALAVLVPVVGVVILLVLSVLALFLAVGSVMTGA